MRNHPRTSVGEDRGGREFHLPDVAVRADFLYGGVPMPPFPEYVSGHSAFSAASARILASVTGSDLWGSR